VADATAKAVVLANEKQAMTDDRNAIMGRLIVAEGLLKDWQDKAKDEAEKRDKALADWARADAQHAQRLEDAKRSFNVAKGTLEQIADMLIEWRKDWSDDVADFDTYYGEIAELLEVEFIEEVEVEVTFSQTVTVKKPIGTELTAQDFWLQKDCELLDCNYEITQEESASVEDISE
jgi:hypothetical protein